jgi:hypothetical protein
MLVTIHGYVAKNLDTSSHIHLLITVCFIGMFSKMSADLIMLFVEGRFAL